MRVTVTIEDGLYRRAKIKAAEEGVTFSGLVARALEGRVADETPFELIVSREAGGMLHGLSTDDISGILDFLDEEDAGRPGSIV